MDRVAVYPDVVGAIGAAAADTDGRQQYERQIANQCASRVLVHVNRPLVAPNGGAARRDSGPPEERHLKRRWSFIIENNSGWATYGLR